MMGCFLIVTHQDFEQLQPAERPNWILRAMERGEVVDLTKPHKWGQFVDYAVKEAYKAEHPGAEIGRRISVIKPDGSEGIGYYDIYDPVANHIIEVKTYNIDAYSSMTQVIRETKALADQLEKYRWSKDIPGRPALVAAFDRAPQNPQRRAFIENFLAGRGINVIWGWGA
jgi:hypothetical protein